MLEVTDKKSQTKEEKMFAAVMGESKEKQFTHVNIERVGNKIILPEGMSYDSAIEWLGRQKESEESIISVSYKIKAFPIDGAYALYCAIKEIFGFAMVVGKKSPSGNNPPEMIDVKLPSGEIVRVPWGRIDLPGFDSDSFVRTQYEPSTLSFVVNGQIRKKFEPMFNLITQKVEEILKTKSLYKGRAVKLDLTFMESGDDPIDPEFIDISNVTRDSILLTDIVKRDYSAVLLRIEKTQRCIKNNIPLKHGCLLAGSYGTGWKNSENFLRY